MEVHNFYEKERNKEDRYLVAKQEIREIFEINKARYEYRRIFASLRQKGYWYYNNERISLKLKGMSPVQYRTHSQI